MKIGVFSDIHNNLPALEAILDQMSECEIIVCCGDLIGIGPHPEETVQRILRIPNLISVQGNHDRYFTEGLPSSVPNDEDMQEGEIGMHLWEHARLSEASANFLRGLPLQAQFTAGGLNFAVQHYAIEADRRYAAFAPAPDGDTLNRLFSAEEADVILYGHDHAPCTAAFGQRLFVNPGAAGCPGRERHIARAAILNVENHRADVRPLEIPYDAASVATDIGREAYPDHAAVRKFFFGIDG